MNVSTQRIFTVIALFAMITTPAWAGDLTITTYSSAIMIEGGFNVSGNTAHYWNSFSGYHTLNTDTGGITDIGTPASYKTNYGGDPFGLYHADTNKFYAATYYSESESYLYEYDYATETWSEVGMAVNIYGGDFHNGQLYISGLIEPWSGGFDSNYISLFDMSGNNNHDALIETGGASAHVALDAAGNVYYAAYGDWGTEGRLYRWSAAAVQGVVNDLAGGDEDTYLTLAEGELLSTLPAGGNGITVDSSGAVFFTINNWNDSTKSGLLRWDSTMGTGESENYEVVYSAADAGSSAGWFGPVAIEGSFDNGDTLYASLNFYGTITGITAVPEPVTMALLAVGGLALLRRGRRN